MYNKSIIAGLFALGSLELTSCDGLNTEADGHHITVFHNDGTADFAAEPLGATYDVERFDMRDSSAQIKKNVFASILVSPNMDGTDWSNVPATKYAKLDSSQRADFKFYVAPHMPKAP